MQKPCYALLAAALVAIPIQAQSQAYPIKTIRTIMTVGGAVDVAVRQLSDKMSQSMGQPVIVESFSGAGGSVGAGMIARAAPDGYTIGMATTSAMVMRPFLSKNVPYNTLTDFTPLSQIAEAVAIVAVNGKRPYSTVQELIAYAKANPNKLTYASSGIGTTHHLSGVMLMKQAGIQMRHVPYKSGRDSNVAVVAGDVDVMFGVLATARGFMKTGEIKVLAINGGKRFKATPDLPTVNEIVPGYQRPAGWMAYFGPAGLPEPIAKRLHAEIVKGMNDPTVIATFEKLSLLIETSESPQAFAAEVKQIYKEAGEMVKAAGIKMQ